MPISHCKHLLPIKCFFFHFFFSLFCSFNNNTPSIPPTIRLQISVVSCKTGPCHCSLGSMRCQPRLGSRRFLKRPAKSSAGLTKSNWGVAMDATCSSSVIREMNLRTRVPVTQTKFSAKTTLPVHLGKVPETACTSRVLMSWFLRTVKRARRALKATFTWTLFS